MKHLRFTTAPLYLLLILLALTAACSSTGTTPEEVAETTGDEGADAVATVAVEPSSTPEATTPAPTATSAPQDTPTATSPPPTATTEAQPQALQLVEYGFGQNKEDVGVAFVVQNPNAGHTIEGANYEIALLDDSGETVDTLLGTINTVFPGQTLGVGDSRYLGADVTIDAIEVSLSGGELVADDTQAGLAATSVRYFPGLPSPTISGVIESTYERDFADVRVHAILYDASDQIVGGGFTFVNFVPAQGTAGLRMPVKGLETAERAELFPVLSNLSALDDRELPAGIEPAAVVQSGFGHRGINLGFGMILENSNPGHILEALEYQVIAYAADGTVLGVSEGHAPALLPGQTLGVGGRFFLIADEPVERVQAQVSGGDYVEATSEQLHFSSDDATFEPGAFSGEVNGFVSNPYAQNIKNLFVSAILYDDAGQIIGGGSGYLENAPAQSSSAVKVSVNSSGEPATIEIHAGIDGRSVLAE